MPTRDQHGCSLDTRDDVVLSWTVHLARSNPIKTLASVLVMSATATAAYYAIGPAGIIAAAFIMLSALADFLFPVTYILNSEGAEARMLFKKSVINWSNVKRCYLDDSGVKLSPLNTATRLEAFRGVYLRFHNNKEQVIQTVKSLREADNGN